MVQCVWEVPEGTATQGWEDSSQRKAEPESKPGALSTEYRDLEMRARVHSSLYVESPSVCKSNSPHMGAVVLRTRGPAAPQGNRDDRVSVVSGG